MNEVKNIVLKKNEIEILKNKEFFNSYRILEFAKKKHTSFNGCVYGNFYNSCLNEFKENLNLKKEALKFATKKKLYPTTLILIIQQNKIIFNQFNEIEYNKNKRIK